MEAPAAPRLRLLTKRKNNKNFPFFLTLPIATAIPAASEPMPASRSKRGWGRSCSLLTKIGKRGARGKPSSWGKPENDRNLSTTPSISKGRANSTATLKRWPFLTGTRAQLTRKFISAGKNCVLCHWPKIFFVSLSIFSSSLLIKGRMLSAIDRAETPLRPAPVSA